MSFLLLLALPIILILYFQTQKPKPAKKLHPPATPRQPFIGNLHQLNDQSPHMYLQRLSKKYGPIMSLKLGFRQDVIVSSADVVKEIMKSHATTSFSRVGRVSSACIGYHITAKMSLFRPITRRGGR